MNLKSLIFSVFSLSLLFVASCQSGKSKGDQKPTVALVMKSLANEFFKTMADGAEAHQKENSEKYELVVNGIKNETDLSAQVELVEQMVARGVDAIVIAPADSKALVSVLKRATAAGIVVINIDNKLDEEVLSQASLKIPFVGPDNLEGATQVGKVMADYLKPGSQVAILEGVPTAFNSIRRRQGFENALKTKNLQVVSIQSGLWEMEKANTVTSAIISEYPEIKGVLCANDSMALGAAAAIKAANQSKQIKVVGFDNISAIQPLLEDGSVIATADQYSAQLAVFGIEAALEALEKGSEDVPDKKTPVKVITE